MNGAEDCESHAGMGSAPDPIAPVAEAQSPQRPLCTMRECMPMRGCGTSQVGHARNVKGETSECHGCYGIPTDPGDSSRRSYPRTLGPRSLASTALHCAHPLLCPPMPCHVLCDTWCVRGCVRACARARSRGRVRARAGAGVCLRDAMRGRYAVVSTSSKSFEIFTSTSRYLRV